MPHIFSVFSHSLSGYLYLSLSSSSWPLSLDPLSCLSVQPVVCTLWWSVYLAALTDFPFCSFDLIYVFFTKPLPSDSCCSALTHRHVFIFKVKVGVVKLWIGRSRWLLQWVKWSLAGREHTYTAFSDCFELMECCTNMRTMEEQNHQKNNKERKTE